MSYLNCPQCRLSVRTVGGGSRAESCPRCEAPLEGAPRSMFALQSPNDDGDPFGRHSLVRSALVSTGLFRDGTPAAGDRSPRSL